LSPWSNEILPHFWKFLRPLRGGDVDDREEISNASAVRKGKRYFTYAATDDHAVVIVTKKGAKTSLLLTRRL